MNNPFQIQPELRYGAPVCDEILTGRNFSIRSASRVVT